MLSHVWAWLRRTLKGRCNPSHYFFTFFGFFNKRVKNKTLIAHLYEAVEPLNAEGHQHTSVSFKKELRFKMSDTSGPLRIRMLELNVGEMKAELSHIRARTEQMMGHDAATAPGYVSRRRPAGSEVRWLR